MKISISIPTYNRLDHIEILSKSLKDVIGIERHNIRIYDDYSLEFSLDRLSDLFPNAKKISRNEYNLGADRNLYHIMKDFIKSGDDVLFVCDSDLIVHAQCLLFIEEYLDQTDGVMSVYNSALHPVKDEINSNFVTKKSIGAAGSVYTRSMVLNILKNIPEELSNYLDWAISFYLDSMDKKIYVSQRSYVQHIGIKGENNNLLALDYGVNFPPVTEFEKQQMAVFYEEFFIAYTSITPYNVVKRHYRRKFMGLLKWLMIKLLGYKFTLRVLSFKKKQSDKKNK